MNSISVVLLLLRFSVLYYKMTLLISYFVGKKSDVYNLIVSTEILTKSPDYRLTKMSNQ